MSPADLVEILEDAIIMQPSFTSIKNWTEISGLGRTTTYYLIKEQRLKAIKAGRRTLIDVEAGMAYLRSQPAADIRCARPAGKVAV